MHHTAISACDAYFYHYLFNHSCLVDSYLQLNIEVTIPVCQNPHLDEAVPALAVEYNLDSRVIEFSDEYSQQPEGATV